MSNPQQTRQDSPLLRLPGEIRNHIYTHLYFNEIYAFERHGFNTRSFRYKHLTSTTQSCQPYPSLAAVCRQLYTETALLPFLLGTVLLDNIETLEELTYRLTPSQLSSIRTLWVRVPLGGSNVLQLFVQRSRKRGPGLSGLKGYLPGVSRVQVEVMRSYNELRDNGARAWSLRVRKLVERFERWVAAGGGDGIEVRYCGYGIDRDLR